MEQCTVCSLLPSRGSQSGCIIIPSLPLSDKTDVMYMSVDVSVWMVVCLFGLVIIPALRLHRKIAGIGPSCPTTLSAEYLVTEKLVVRTDLCGGAKFSELIGQSSS